MRSLFPFVSSRALSWVHYAVTSGIGIRFLRSKHCSRSRRLRDLEASSCNVDDAIGAICACAAQE